MSPVLTRYFGCLRVARQRDFWSRAPYLQVRAYGLGPRKLATSASPPAFVSTLRPERFVSAKQIILDLSRRNTFSLYPVYYALNGNNRIPFPPDTKGYFYYHSSPDMSELSAGVRFRICDGPDDFARGHDLLTPSKNAWGIPLALIIVSSKRRELLDFVLKENLVDEELVNDLRKLSLPTTLPYYLQNSLAEPVVFDVSKTKVWVQFLTRKISQVKLELPRNLFSSILHGDCIYPLTGFVRLQFELTTLPEHEALGPTLVIRVLDILEPITMDPSNPGGTVVVPETGTLLYRLPRGKKRIWALPILKQKQSAEILQLAKESWPTAKLD